MNKHQPLVRMPHGSLSGIGTDLYPGRSRDIQTIFDQNTSPEEIIRLLQQYRYAFLAEGGASVVYVNHENSLVLKIFFLEKPVKEQDLNRIEKVTWLQQARIYINNNLNKRSLQWVKMLLKQCLVFIRLQHNEHFDVTRLHHLLLGYELGIRLLPTEHLLTRLVSCPLETLCLQIPDNVTKNLCLVQKILHQKATIVIQEKFQEEFLLLNILMALAHKHDLDGIQAKICAVFDFYEQVLWPKRLFEIDMNLFENYLIFPDNTVMLHDFTGLTNNMPMFLDFSQKIIKYAHKELVFLHKSGKLTVSERTGTKLTKISRQLLRIEKYLPASLHKEVAIFYLEEILRRFDEGVLSSKLFVAEP